jgi:hypothetical protein
VIPSEITREHVLAAIQRIEADGVPPGRQSQKFYVRYEGKLYPPKLLVSFACEAALGRVLPSGLFSGGAETNGFLQRLGFDVTGPSGEVISSLQPSSRTSSHKAADNHKAEPLATAQLNSLKDELLYRGSLHLWEELQADRRLPPSVAGVYAWFFKSIPSGVPTDGCVRREGRVLLYVGISPTSLNSSETLRSRMRYHYRGNAEGSTLRLTIGCLLEDEIGTVLRRVGSGNRMTFGPNEKRLTEWLAKNAAVGWLEIAEPWVLEEHIIATTSLPLNIESNNRHVFCEQIRRIRADARQRARAMPILARDDT